MKRLRIRFRLLLPVLVLLAGCTATHYRSQVEETALTIIAEKQQAALGQSAPFSLQTPAEMLRQRLLRDQNLPFAGPASLGAEHLPPVAHWPEPERTASRAPAPPPAGSGAEEVSLTLKQALEVAALNSREYQSHKEELFRSALALDFERNSFRTTLSGSLAGSYLQDRSMEASGGDPVAGGAANLLGGISRLFVTGVNVTTRIGWDLIRMLQPGHESASGLFGDASITIPLLRGAGRHIAAESLTQAERDTVYAVWEFERYKKEFAVTITDRYLAVLQAADILRNQEENYRGLIASTRRARRLAEAGKLPQIQVDQSLQNELRARDRWVAARQTSARVLDEFKTLLGLPADALITLDRNEFRDLESALVNRLEPLFADPSPVPAAGADEPIVLQPPSPHEAGLYELEPSRAIRLALENRMDLQARQQQVTDAQRKVVVAADALLPELTLFGSAATGTRRTIAALQPDDNNRLAFDEGVYQGLLTLDLPWERTAEAIAYRDSYIALERAVRSFQELEDLIKLQVRNDLRDLEQARASLQVQYQAVKLAERRVRGAELELQAGRAQMRDLLESRDALLTAQNALTAAMVAYRMAELAMQRDLDVLRIDEQGVWHETPAGGPTHDD